MLYAVNTLVCVIRRVCDIPWQQTSCGTLPLTHTAIGWMELLACPGQGAASGQCRQAPELLHLPLSVQTTRAGKDNTLFAPVPYRGENRARGTHQMVRYIMILACRDQTLFFC